MSLRCHAISTGAVCGSGALLWLVPCDLHMLYISEMSLLCLAICIGADVDSHCAVVLSRCGLNGWPCAVA